MHIKKFHIRNIKITYRLFIAFFSLALLVIFVISTSQFYWYTNETKAKIGDYALGNLTQITIALDNSLSRMDDYYLEIASSEVVQTALTEKPLAGSIEYLNNQYRFHETVVEKYSFFKYIKNIYLLTPELTPALSYTNISRDSNLSPDMIRQIAESDKNSHGERRWKAVPVVSESGTRTGKNKDSLVLHSPVYSRWHQETAGYMVAEIRPAFFLDNFSEPQSAQGIETFLMDSEGVIMASFDYEVLPIGKKHRDSDIIHKINTNPNYFAYNNETQSGMLACVPVKNTNLYAVSIIPDSYFISANQSMKSFIMLTVIIFLLLSAVITFVITKSIHVPLKQLSLEMELVKQGNFILPKEDPYQDELSEIKTSFSYMVKEVERLTQDIRSQARQKKLAEIAALQAQINPHFLSNTLGSIQWMAQIQGAGNIEDITKNLIHLLHMCARKGNTWIPIREELEYLNCYINVQTYRYLDKFQVHMEADEAILETKIPQFILQPILENALIHGIEPMPGQGNILIRCKKAAKNRIQIMIEDNGIGIPPEKIADIFKNRGTSKGNFNNIGLNNIRERLTLYYGQDFSFDIESKEGEYTKVTLELAAQRNS